MVIIHVVFHLVLLSITIISHVRYASVIIIIDVHLFIFKNGFGIIIESNNINEKSIPSLHFRLATSSHKRVMIVASLLRLAYANQRRGSTASCRC